MKTIKAIHGKFSWDTDEWPCLSHRSFKSWNDVYRSNLRNRWSFEEIVSVLNILKGPWGEPPSWKDATPEEAIFLILGIPPYPKRRHVNIFRWGVGWEKIPYSMFVKNMRYVKSAKEWRFAFTLYGFSSSFSGSYKDLVLFAEDCQWMLDNIQEIHGSTI